MLPEQVPAELVDSAMARREVGTVVWPHELRAILAAVLPAHRAMVLESVACQPPGVAVLTEEDLAARDAEIEQRVRAKVAEQILTVQVRVEDATQERAQGIADRMKISADLAREGAAVAAPPKTVAEMVAEFHAAVGDKPGKGLPGIKDVPERTIRRSLLAEEYAEYLDAEWAEDRVAIADALADMAYVIYGSAYTYGIPLDDVLAEVHRSNMTKDFTTEPGQKIRKGPDYSPPDIAAVLARGERP